MADTNIFEELKEALDEFQKFLADNISTIKPAVQALASGFPKINELIGELIELVKDLSKEIEEFDVSQVGGEELTAALGFVDKVKAVAEASKTFLPDGSDAVLGAASIVSSVPDLDTIKGEIVKVLTGPEPDSILNLLQDLQAPA